MVSANKAKTCLHVNVHAIILFTNTVMNLISKNRLTNNGYLLSVSIFPALVFLCEIIYIDTNKLSQWLCHDNNTTSIAFIIIIIYCKLQCNTELASLSILCLSSSGLLLINYSSAATVNSYSLLLLVLICLLHNLCQPSNQLLS